MRWVLVVFVALGCEGGERSLARAAPLFRESCEPEQILARAKGWLAAGELRRLLDETEAWEGRCGMSRALVRADAEPLAWRAAAWERLNKLGEAAEDYARALEIDPHRTRLLEPLFDIDSRRQHLCHIWWVVRRMRERDRALANDGNVLSIQAKLPDPSGKGGQCE